VLVEDDDGHWYVIPRGLQKQFQEWVEFTFFDEKDEDDEWEGYDFESCSVGGDPSLVVFTGYRIEGEGENP